MFRLVAGLLILAPVTVAVADQGLEIEQVSDSVYAVVGPFGNRTPDNLGNNASFGFVVTDEGVILIDPGGSYQGAAAIHEAISGVTSQPVRVVINTGGQDHRWLGQRLFQGARRTHHQQQGRGCGSKGAHPGSADRLGNLIGDAGLDGTTPVYADGSSISAWN